MAELAVRVYYPISAFEIATIYGVVDGITSGSVDEGRAGRREKSQGHSQRKTETAQTAAQRHGTGQRGGGARANGAAAQVSEHNIFIFYVHQY